MPRLPLICSAAAVAVLMTTAPFLGSSSAAACPAWTDPPSDASTAELPNPTGDIGDQNLDIVAASVTTTGDSLVAKIKTMKLTATSSDYGDEFVLAFTINGKSIEMYTDRGVSVNGQKAPAGFGQGFYNVTDESDTPIAAAAVYDVASSTVTITGKLSELATALGSAPAGKEISKLSANTYNSLASLPLMPYDTAAAPATAVATAGTACGGSGGGTPPPTTAPPTTAPPTTPPAGELPAGYPAAGCNTFTDGKGDGTPDAPVSNASGPVVEGQNDPDLDIVGVALGSTDTDFVAAVRLDDLKALPSLPMGHHFEVTFVHNTKAITVYAQQYDAVGSAGRTVLANNPQGAPVPAVGGRLAGTYNANLKVTATFDVTNNLVLFKLTRDSLATVAGAPAPDGTTFTAVAASSRQLTTPLGGSALADSAQHTDAEQRTFTLGDGPCYGPPAGALTITGARTAQFSDGAAVAAKLATGAGAPLKGKRVTFAVGSKSVSAVTGADGVARTTLNPGLAAGAYSLVVSFAGDAAAGKASATAPFTVTEEKTKLALAVAKKGTRRTVTAKLLDDDRKPVAGQTVTWYVNGAKKSTGKTSASGTATFTTAKPTQTVKVVFTRVAGKYLAATAQVKV